jgi:hypothetical protein
MLRMIVTLDFFGVAIMAFNLKTKVWQTGALDWWAMIDNDDVYLGSREFPLPPEEGDEWHVRKTGDKFKVVDGEICKTGNEPFTEDAWLK